jgi:hypothetical protein
MKRALIIVASLIVLIGIGVGTYFFFFAPQPHLTATSGGSAFADAGSDTAAAGTGDASGSGGAGTVVAPNFVKIAAGPVAAGMVAFDIAPRPIVSSANVTSASSSVPSTSILDQSFSPPDTEVRYIDRESGNVYAYRAQSRTLTRLSNKTLPGIQEASWLPDGSTAFVRFLTKTSNNEQVNTYALPFDGNGGYFLQQNLAQAFVSGATSIFTLTTGNSSSIGSLARADGTSPQTLFTSPLTSIIAHAAGASVIASTKAAAAIDGYAFTISAGRFTPVLGPFRGLTVLPSSSGNLLLYSYTDGSNFHMNVLNLSTGVATALPLVTLAEKCVWTTDDSALYCAIPTSLDGNLPDDWYQGAVSLSDRIWRIDLSSRLATLILNPIKTGKVDIDAVNLTLDPNTQVLVFRNKKDSSLWAYNL